MCSAGTGELPKLLSVDDHVIEPPNVWTDRLPSKFQEAAPRIHRKKLSEIHHAGGVSYDFEIVVDDQEGTWGDVWYYEGQPIYSHKRNTIIPRSAVSGSGERTLLDMSGMELGLLCIKAYNDWMVEEWCDGSDGVLIPLCIVPLWDPELAAAEIRRNAAGGVHAVAFSEIPVHLGLPSVHSGAWDPFFAACEETAATVNMHIGSSSKMPMTSADAGLGVAGMLVWVNSLSSLADFWEQHNNWTNLKDKVPERPSSYYYSNVYVCSVRDPFGLDNLKLVGEDNVTFETDYPHTNTTWPNTKAYAEKVLAELTHDQKYKIMRSNAIKMLSLDIK